jgi:intein/homing endonuclease
MSPKQPTKKKLFSPEDILDPTEILDKAIANGLDSGYSDLEEGDIEFAPNAVEWMTGAKFLNVRPYPKQLQDILHYFTSVCYFCSDTDYLVDIPVDANLPDIFDRMQPMEFGRCPQCKRNVVEMRHEWCLDPKNTYEGYIKPDQPNELCAVKGQRCVVGSTLVQSRHQGLVPIKTVEIGEELWTPRGWKKVRATYKFKNKKTYRIKLRGGLSLRGGLKHRVLVITDTGKLKFRRFSKLKVGDRVACQPKDYCRLTFNRVVEIEQAPRADLYDLNIDGHTYWSQGIVSHNSGKSIQTAMMSTYVIHQFLQLPNPGKWFRLLKRQVLHATFVSVTATQAWENLWQPVSDLIDGSPWFDNYHEFLDSEGERVGAELWNKKDTYLWYGHKALAISFSSSDVRTLRGRTRLLCVAPDSIVSSNMGQVEIGSICKDPGLAEPPPDLILATHKKPTKPSLLIRREPEPTLKLETEHGYELIGSYDQPVFVLKPDATVVKRLLKHTKPGDRLILGTRGVWPTKIPSWVWSRERTGFRQTDLESGLPTKLSLDLARVLGYHGAEGSLSVGNGNHQFRFSNTDPQVFKDFVHSFQRALNFTPKTYRVPKESITKATKDAYIAEMYSKDLCDWLTFLGAGGKSGTKEVPWVILQAPKPFVIEYLRALFEGDGHVDENLVRLELKSKRLVRQVHVLLTYLGIVGRFRSCYRPEYDATYWNVALFGHDRNLFLEKVGFLEFKPRPSRYSKEGEFDLDLSLVRSCQLQRTSAVTEVVPGPNIETCDFTIPGPHSFYANGLAVGNSGIDELAWFSSGTATSGKIRADGDGTWRALDRSLATIRNGAAAIRKNKFNTPDGHMFCLSSPSSVTDPIMRRYRKASKSPRMYAVKSATWECNPHFTEESLRAQEGDVDEVTFLCDFGASPPFANDPWWGSQAQLLGLCRTDHHERPLFTYSQEMQADVLGGQDLMWIWGDLKPSPDKQTPRILALDTGEKNCSFSWCLAHYLKHEDTVVIDQVGEIAPGDDHRIHLGNMWEKVILPLVKSFHFLYVVWDRWESSQYVSDLRTKYFVRAEQYTSTRADANQLRSDMLNSKISFPQPEIAVEDLPIGDNRLLAMYPTSNLLLQVMTVRKGNGGVPIKPQGGNDDTFRTVLLADTYIRNYPLEFGRYQRAFGGGSFMAGGSRGRGRGGRRRVPRSGRGRR